MTQNNQELGALRSEMTLILHSQYANRLWLGRPTEKDGKNIIKAQIISMPNALSILSRIQKDASFDDPYADWYLIQFENQVLAGATKMKSYIDDIADIYADLLPENMNIQAALNMTPVGYPIYANSQLGYKLIYLLADFDILARSIQTASHIALMTRKDAYTWLDSGAKLIRRCFGIVENYRHSGISRQDVRDNNARYQEAKNRFKFELPHDVLDGSRRAEFAPIIRVANTEAELDDAVSVLDSNETEVL